MSDRVKAGGGEPLRKWVLEASRTTFPHVLFGERLEHGEVLTVVPLDDLRAVVAERDERDAALKDALSVAEGFKAERDEARAALERCQMLAQGIERDRRESDKVLAQAQDVVRTVGRALASVADSDPEGAQGHDWERTSLNGDGGSGSRYQWACRRCDHREWWEGDDGPGPGDTPDHPCRPPASSSGGVTPEGRGEGFDPFVCNDRECMLFGRPHEDSPHRDRKGRRWWEPEPEAAPAPVSSAAVDEGGEAAANERARAFEARVGRFVPLSVRYGTDAERVEWLLGALPQPCGNCGRPRWECACDGAEAEGEDEPLCECDGPHLDLIRCSLCDRRYEAPSAAVRQRLADAGREPAERISRTIAETLTELKGTDPTSRYEQLHRVAKIAEELGEFAEALSAYHGENPRKPRGTLAACLDELADIVLAAQVGIEYFGGDPRAVIAARAEFVLARLHAVSASGGEGK